MGLAAVYWLTLISEGFVTCPLIRRFPFGGKLLLAGEAASILIVTAAINARADILINTNIYKWLTIKWLILCSLDIRRMQIH